MRRSLLALVLCLALYLPLTAQQGKGKAVPLLIQGNTLIIVKSVPFQVVAPKGATLYDWTAPDSVKVTAEDEILTITQAPNGTFTIRVRMTTIDFDKKSVTRQTGEIEVNYGGVTPGPGPGPDPKPDPDNPAPIPVAGFRVLLVYETAELSKLPQAQSAIIYAKSVRDYLNAKCVVGPDNKTKEWRFWDKDTDASGESKLWQDVMKRERKSLPWLIISNHPRGGYEGPLLGSIDETLKLLKQYGGN